MGPLGLMAKWEKRSTLCADLWKILKCVRRVAFFVFRGGAVCSKWPVDILSQINVQVLYLFYSPVLRTPP